MPPRTGVKDVKALASIFSQNPTVLLEIWAYKWLREFVAALPRGWRDKVGAKRWIVLGCETTPSLVEYTKHKPIAISVPRQDFLIRQIEIPLASRFQISNLMKFEAPRHVPLPLDKACLDFRILNHDISRCRTMVELAIIRSESVETAIQNANIDSKKIEGVYLLTANGPWVARRAIPLNWRERWLNQRHRNQYFSFGIPTLLCVLWVLAAQNWAAHLAADRNVAEVTAWNQAARIEPLRLQLAALNDELGYLSGIRERASAVGVTEEVARILPDSAWLQELDIEDQTVRMLGTAQDATDLLRDFSTSSLFINVQFEAPLTQAIGASGDQFDILMTRR